MFNWAKKSKLFLLSFNTLTFASTQILLFALFPFLSDALNLSLSTIVSCFTLGTVLFLWGAPFWTNKSDTLGRQKVMNYALLGFSLSFIILTLLVFFKEQLSSTMILALLILSRILYGLTASAIAPVAQAMRIDLDSGNEHIKSMFSHSLTLNLGRTLGPVLLLITNQVELLLLALSLWSLVLVFINFTAPNALHKSSFVEKEIAWSQSAKEIFWPLSVTILFTSFTGILHSSLGGTIQSAFQLDSVSAGKFMAQILLAGSATMICIQFAGRTLKKLRWQRTLLIGVTSLFLGALILLKMTAMNELIYAIIFISAGIALIQPSNLTSLHEMNESQNFGKKVGLLSSGNTIGYAIGGALTSLLFNFNINFIACVVASALFLVAIISGQKGSHAKN